jgi:taurine dioxygenase
VATGLKEEKAMELRPLDAPLGVEVTGIDLTAPIAEADRTAMRDALSRHGVLVVRGQSLDASQFVRFARGFGEIEMYDGHLADFLLEGQREIIVLSNIERDGKPIGVVDAGTYWHTDRSYVPKPAWSSCLYALEVPHADDGTPLGDTEFASMAAALAALPEAMQARLETLRACHEYVFRFSRRNDSLPGVEHPVVLRHPLTGARCLFVNKGFTHHMVGMSEEEGNALLEALYEHARRPEFVYRHQWRVGDLVMWDNYATQHRATGGYALPRRRHMWRTTIQGFPLQ